MANVNFDGIQFISNAPGLLNYDKQPFSATIPGQTLAAFSGSLSSYSYTISLPKNLPNIAPTSRILVNPLANFDNINSAGEYISLTDGIPTKDIIIGSAGGFPIFYGISVYCYSDSVNFNIFIFIANGSAVNAVTVPTIHVMGTAYFFLAQF